MSKVAFGVKQGTSMSNSSRFRNIRLQTTLIVAFSLLAQNMALAQCTIPTPTPINAQDAGDAIEAPILDSVPSDDILPNGVQDAESRIPGFKTDTGGWPASPSGDSLPNDFGGSQTQRSFTPGLDAIHASEGWGTWTGLGEIYSGGLEKGALPNHGHPQNYEPIDGANANKFDRAVDYSSLGADTLNVGRVYNSNPTARPATVTVNMGVGWHGYYDRTVQQLSASQVRLHRANGQTIDFTNNGTAWVSSVPDGILTSISGGWQYVNDLNAIETYSSAGKLLNISTGGLVSTMQYDASQRLMKVVNHFGRSLSFGYDGVSRVSTITLPDNNTIGYSYDGAGNLSTVRFSDNSTRRYLYENTSFPNAMTGKLDESGRRVQTWGYDTYGRPTSGHIGTGTASFTVAYSGPQVVTTDARGTQRTRTYATFNGRPVLTAIQTSTTADAAATAWSFGFDANGNPQSMTTRTGEVQQFTADARGRVTATTKAYGTPLALSSQTTWHPTFRLPTQVVSLGVTTNFTIDTLGRLTQASRTSGSTTAIVGKVTYNAQNLVQSVTDARGASHSYVYDAAGNVSSYTDEAGRVTTFQNYNAHGQAGTITRGDGTVITRTFDARFRVKTRTVAGATTQYDYDSAGRVTKMTEPDATWRSFTYDDGGYLINVGNSRSETIVITRDATGSATQVNAYSASNSLAAQSTTVLDSVGRAKSLVDSRNYATKLLYATDGRISGVTDPLNLTRTIQLDALNRLASTTVPNTTAMRNGGGGATVSATQSYSQSNHSATTDTKVVATGYAHDGFNWLTGESGNDAGSVGYLRSAASGDVISKTDALNVTMTPSIDSLGRITTLASSGATTRTYAYVSNRTDRLLSSMTDESGSTAWSYDSLGRVLTQNQTIQGNSTVQRNLTITRDSLGRPSSVTYPSGMVLGFNYTADVVSSMTVNGTTLLSNVTYLPFSQVATGWLWGNGTSYTRTFDADGRVTSVSLGSKVRSYVYDAAGRVTSQTDTAGPIGSPGATTTYAYDEAGQLISYVPPTGFAQTFTYDTNGNRQTEVFNGVASSYNYVSGTNRLSTLGSIRGYSYNADGSAIFNGNGYNITYDHYGQVTAAGGTAYPNALSSFYKRNGLGQIAFQQVNYKTCTSGPPPQSPMTDSLRKRKTVFTTSQTIDPQTSSCTSQVLSTTNFTYDQQGNLLGEYANGGAPPVETIWFNGQPVASIQGGVVYYISADNLGTPRSVVRATDNIELWRWDSDPFGTNAPTNPNPTSGGVNISLRFPGQIYDSVTKFHHNGAREYDPRVGRYLQADPTGLAGGLSRYSYASANPLSYIDPTGKRGLGLVFSGVAEAGVGPLGSGVNATVGAGVFNSRQDGITFGGFSTAAVYPNSDPSAQSIWGAALGTGPGFFFTSANTVEDLRGTSPQWSLNTPIGAVTVSSDGQKIWIVTVTTGVAGASFSKYNSRTINACSVGK